MATNFPPPSVNTASDATTRFVQLKTEIENKFTDLHQMLDDRKQQLLDKLTELEEIHNKYVIHTEAISKLSSAIANMNEILNDVDILENAQESALTILQPKLENLEKENVKSVNIDYLKVTCDKAEFQHCINFISISDSKIAFQYSNRTAPILSKVNRGTNKGEISHPHGICIDDDVNEVYICDSNSTHGSRIHVFSLEGVFIREFGKDHLNCPHGITLSSSDVFVTSCKVCHCLMKFNKNGTFVKKAGSLGRGDGQFYWPQGLCVANASVFVCDYENNRIQAFDFDLHFLFNFTSDGFKRPSAIILHSNQLFVSTEYASMIFVHSLGGTCIKSMKLSSESFIQFGFHELEHHFDIDAHGNFIFSEFSTSRIKIYSSTGEYVTSFGKPYLQFPRGLAINKHGLIVCISYCCIGGFQTY